MDESKRLKIREHLNGTAIARKLGVTPEYRARTSISRSRRSG